MLSKVLAWLKNFHVSKEREGYEVKKRPKTLQCGNSAVLLRTNYYKKKSKKVIVTNMNDAEILHFNLETRCKNSA